jgi:hypothetical protein
MSIFDELAAHQGKTPFASSSEASFFAENAYLLSTADRWRPFSKPSDPFQTIRANIILRALHNKTTIEKAYSSKIKADRDSFANDENKLSVEDYMRNVLVSLPYLTFAGSKVYVPIFPEALNVYYVKSWGKLLMPPYKNLISDFQAMTVDPFDYYGYALYDSYFTRLVPIRRTSRILAAYDYDAEALYFIDDQGRLDARICFFDKGIKAPVKAHMVKRIGAVADCYFANDRPGMIKALIEGNLVSSSLMHQIAGKEIAFETKIGKKEQGDR